MKTDQILTALESDLDKDGILGTRAKLVLELTAVALGKKPNDEFTILTLAKSIPNWSSYAATDRQQAGRTFKKYAFPYLSCVYLLEKQAGKPQSYRVASKEASDAANSDQDQTQRGLTKVYTPIDELPYMATEKPSDLRGPSVPHSVNTTTSTIEEPGQRPCGSKGVRGPFYDELTHEGLEWARGDVDQMNARIEQRLKEEGNATTKGFFKSLWSFITGK